jgi:hypothetical protein
MPELTKEEQLLIVTIALWEIRYYEKWWLLKWLGYEPTLKPVPKATFFSSKLHLDWCAYCKTSFGKTIGGRLRHGCPSCKGYVDHTTVDLVDRFWVPYTGLPADARLLDIIEELNEGII